MHRTRGECSVTNKRARAEAATGLVLLLVDEVVPSWLKNGRGPCAAAQRELFVVSGRAPSIAPLCSTTYTKLSFMIGIPQSLRASTLRQLARRAAPPLACFRRAASRGSE